MKRLTLIVLFLCIYISAKPQEFVLPDSLAVLLQDHKKQDIERMDALQRVVDALFDATLYNEALPYINELSIIANNSADNYYISLAYYYNGVCFSVNSHFEKAFKQLKLAQNIANTLYEDKANQFLRIRIHLALSSCFILSDMLSEALDQLQKGLELNAIVKDPKIEVKLNNNLATLYSQMNKLYEANAIYKKMLSNPDLFQKGNFYSNYNIGSNFLRLHLPDSALSYLKKAKEQIVSQKDKALVCNKIGRYYTQKGDLNTAIDYQEEALRNIIYNSDNYADVYVTVLTDLVDNYYKLHQYDSAMAYINKGMAIAKKFKLLRDESNFTWLKISILSSIHPNMDGFTYIKKYKLLTDSLLKIQNLERVNQLMVRQEIKTIEKEMQQQQYINELEYARQKNKLYIILALLVFTIIIIGLFLNRKRIIIKSKKIQEQLLVNEVNLLNERMDAQNRELTSKVLAQVQKNKLLTDVIAKLSQLHKNQKNIRKSIDDIILELKKSEHNSTLTDFDYYFVQVHPNFYDKLLNDYPGLTQYELRLCAFLKLNLSTKDIATLNNINPDSVVIARKRLRKSLNLTNQNQSLVTFLSKY